MSKKFKEVKKEILGKEKGDIVPKTEEPEEIENLNFPDQFKSTIVKVIDWTFKIIAKRKGKHWELQEEELQELSNSYIALAEKYSPAILNRVAIEINAIFWTAIIIFNRIIK